MSSLIESAAAYMFLGERFQYVSQYIGIFCIVLGMVLIDGRYFSFNLGMNVL
jgi:uncharacterized membrane protein